jgi:hypothetical protein
MAGSAGALSCVAIVRSIGRPGTGLLVLVFALSLAAMGRNAWTLRSRHECE